MNDIKVGEYVRSKDGIIAKVTRIDSLLLDTDMEIYDIGGLNMMEIPIEEVESYIIKHSPNIIDLIEARDYVNGTLILTIEESTYTKIGRKAIRILVYRDHRQDCWETLFEEEIKTIVTKEQFENMKYHVGGKEE